MSHRKKLFLGHLILATLIIALSGCGSLVSKMFTAPKVGVDKVEVTDVAFSGVTLNVTVFVDNPNGAGIKLNHFDYDVAIEGERLANGVKEDPIDIDGNKRNVFTMPVTVAFSGLSSGVKGVLTKDILKYSFKGNVVLDTPIGDLDFDIEEEGDIEVPQPPDFDITKVETDLGLSETTLKFHVLVSNNEKMQLLINKFRYYVAINGHDVTEAKVTVNSALKENKQMKMTIPVVMKLINLKRGLIDALQSGKFSYKFIMDIDLDSKYGPYTLPYLKESMVTMY